MMKRMIAVLLCITLLLITACSNNDDVTTGADDKAQVTDNKSEDNTNESEDKAEGSTTEEKTGLTEVGTYPITNEKKTFTIFSRFEGNMDDMQTNEFTKYLEELTNIEIIYDATPDDSLWDKVNLVIASDDLPDAFMNVWLGATHEEVFGVEEQQLIPLNDIIDQHMPNLKKVLDKYEWMRGAMTASDGNIYGLPGIYENYHTQYQIKMWINKDQLDKLGIPVPNTTEEFYEALKTFKAEVPGAIPLAGATDGWNTNVDSFIMNAFVPDTGMYNALRTYSDNGMLMTSLNQPGYKEGLSYLNRLYSEGLVDSASFTQKQDQLKQLVASEGEPVLAFPTGGLNQVIDPTTNPELYSHYVALAPLEGPTGMKMAMNIPNYPFQPMFAITRVCEDPVALARWADAFYDYDVQLSKWFGVKGRDWDDAESGEVGLDGEQALYKVMNSYGWDTQQNTVWNTNGIWYMPNEWALGKAVDGDIDIYSPEGSDKLLTKVTADEYEVYSSLNEGVTNPPPLKLTSAELDDLQIITTELQNYVGESRVQFIFGNLSLEEDWDTYVEALNNIGLEVYMEAQQKAYDRQFKY